VATIVRLLSAADREAWEPLWRDYLTFYNTVLPPETYDLTFARLTGGSEPMGGFLATSEEGEPVGLVHWISHRSCWTANDYCYLQDLFVALKARGTSAGRTLIEAVYAKAQDLGLARVHWLTHETNTTAMQLYDRVADRSGFVQYRKAL
jgi:GNAT superfamily N-acetyltransferase